MAILYRFAIRNFFYRFRVYLFKNVSEPTKPKVDVLSILLSTIGFGGIVYGFSSSGEGWDSFGVWNHSNWPCSTSIFRITSIEIEGAITRP